MDNFLYYYTLYLLHSYYCIVHSHACLVLGWNINLNYGANLDVILEIESEASEFFASNH